jgi:hypothetical protein
VRGVCIGHFGSAHALSKCRLLAFRQSSRKILQHGVGASGTVPRRQLLRLWSASDRMLPFYLLPARLADTRRVSVSRQQHMHQTSVYPV